MGEELIGQQAFVIGESMLGPVWEQLEQLVRAVAQVRANVSLQPEILLDLYDQQEEIRRNVTPSRYRSLQVQLRTKFAIEGPALVAHQNIQQHVGKPEIAAGTVDDPLDVCHRACLSGYYKRGYCSSTCEPW